MTDTARLAGGATPVPANDNLKASTFAWPSMSRILKSGDLPKAKALARWAAMCRPISWPTGLQAANDNRPTDEGWEQTSWAEAETGDALDVERRREIRPTINEIMSAASRVSVTQTRRAPGQWSQPIRRTMQLEFRAGRMTAYFKDGSRYPVSDRLRGPRGRVKSRRSDADVRRYLSTSGVPHFPQWRTHDGGRYVEPNPAAANGRSVLESLGVSGDVRFEDLPFPARRLPTTIAKGSGWIGGVVGSTGKAKPPGWIDIWEEVERTSVAYHLRSRLLPDTVEILDCAVSPMAAREIGKRFGKTGKYAERWAVREIDRALETIAA